MDPIIGWTFVTRWGNSMLLLPFAAWIAVGLWVGGERRVAGRWAVCFAGAVLLALATKVAFLGWGIGNRALDFTGISGHGTLSASVLPMLAWWLAEEYSVPVRRTAIGAAVVVAFAVGLSRLALSAHSTSEVVAGLALGFATAWAAIPGTGMAAGHARFRWVAALVLLLAATVSHVGDSDEAHGVVVRLALGLSGHTTPFTRETM